MFDGQAVGLHSQVDWELLEIRLSPKQQICTWIFICIKVQIRITQQGNLEFTNTFETISFSTFQNSPNVDRDSIEFQLC